MLATEVSGRPQILCRRSPSSLNEFFFFFQGGFASVFFARLFCGLFLFLQGLVWTKLPVGMGFSDNSSFFFAAPYTGLSCPCARSSLFPAAVPRCITPLFFSWRIFFQIFLTVRLSLLFPLHLPIPFPRIFDVQHSPFARPHAPTPYLFPVSFPSLLLFLFS